MTTPHEPSRLGRLKAHYRQVVLRDEIRDGILRTMDRHSPLGTRSVLAPSRPARLLRRSMIVGVATASALAATALLVWAALGPQQPQPAVASAPGQTAPGDRGAAGLHEGQRLRASAAGTLETAVGPHRVSVSPDTDLWLERSQPQDLRFRLDRGRATWTVSPLRPGGHLRVVVGEVSVEVLGTVFTVERSGECSSVSVRSGRVAVRYRETAGEIRASESRRFCPGTTALATPEPTGRESGAQQREASPPVSARRLAAVAAPPPPAPARVPPQAWSEEERLFRDASRLEDNAWARARRLHDYLTRFPEGTFAEDALFQLIRLSYADGNPAQVLRLSEQFLRRYHQGRRTRAVQLLHVQSSVELGLPAHASLPVLESLLPHLDSLPRSEREQAAYLAILAYCGSPRTQLCTRWSERYLGEFPHGRYAPEVQRSQTEAAGHP